MQPVRPGGVVSIVHCSSLLRRLSRNRRRQLAIAQVGCTTSLLALASGLMLSGCGVIGATVGVGSAAVSTVSTVVSAAVGVASTAVEATYDLTKAGAGAVADRGNEPTSESTR